MTTALTQSRSHTMRHRCAVGLALVVVFASSGCVDTMQNQPRPNSQKKNDLGSNPTQIVPGVGTNQIQIGMSEEDAANVKHSSKVVVSEQGEEKWLTYKDDGLEITCQSGQVKGVHFFFLSKEQNTFHGNTKEGIGTKSSIRDVICTYGQPTKITNLDLSESSEWPDANKVGLAYAEEGIAFSFIDKRLSTITVFARQPDYDARWWGDIGDTTELRNIQCDDR